MASLTPQRVDHGWAKRWAAQAYDLARRDPTAVGLTVLVFAGIAFVPQFAVGSIFVSSFELGWVLSLARSRDIGGQAWPMFRDGVVDQFRFARDFLLATLVFFIMQYLFERYALQAPMGAASPMTHEAIYGWPAWVTSAFQGAGFDQVMAAMSFTSLSIYVSMSVGYPGLEQVLTLSLSALRTNLVPLSVLSFIGAFPLWFVAGIVRMSGTPFVAVLYSIALVLFNVVMGYVWYVVGREVFEGKRRNATARAHERASSSVPAISVVS